MHSPDQIKPAIIGLSHIGLPLAVEFGKKRPLIGFVFVESDPDCFQDIKGYLP